MAEKENKDFTAQQRAVAEQLANPDFAGTITDLCKKVKISRNAFYQWMKDPEYLQYIDELISRYTDSELAAVWKALIRKAKQGDVKAIKLYFEMKGKYREKANIELPGAVVIIGGDKLDG